jgi:subtilisin family serine protease
MGDRCRPAQERDVSKQIAQDLKTRGVAPVIVFLKPSLVARGAAARTHAAAPAPDAAVRDLGKHFVTSAFSQDTALAMAAVEKEVLRQGPPPGRAEATKAVAKAVAKEVIPPPAVRFYPNLGVLFGTVNQEGLAALRANKRVEEVTGAPPISPIPPKQIRAAKLTHKVTWGIELMEIPKLWKEGLSGKGVLVGHLDTGVDNRHPALKGGAVAFFTVFDEFGVEVTPAAKAHDTDNHGTHTAGTIAGRPVRGKAIGLAPGARLASAVVIEGGDVVARVLGGIDWAVERGVRVLSMSLGVPGYSEDLLPIIRILRARGVLPVLAVGNEGAGTSRSPGNYTQTLSVGAVDEHRTVADFSSSQRFRRKGLGLVPDLVAPGVNVISARPKSGYQAMDGTSMATPHVAGLAALLFEARPAATADEVEWAIYDSCARPSGLTRDRANRGIPNGPRALAKITSP